METSLGSSPQTAGQEQTASQEPRREHRFICIGCPMGCELLVVTEVSEEGGPPSAVSGNACKIGERYGREEATNPTRVMTSSVRVLGGDMKMLSVKTARPIPKGKIWDCAEAMRGLSVNAPVKIGDIIIKNAASTGVDIIATRNIARGSA